MATVNQQDFAEQSADTAKLHEQERIDITTALNCCTHEFSASISPNCFWLKDTPVEGYVGARCSHGTRSESSLDRHINAQTSVKRMCYIELQIRHAYPNC